MSQRPERVVHQDYVVRVRYSNALPPPPNPPKLLEIPGTGLAGGPYTTASYAAKLVRDQPVNIEADAELGMPIDLVGIPGVFDGDERAISTTPNAKLHPADRDLLKPLSALGKASVGGSVSFLRRTEYTASQAPQHLTNATPKDINKTRFAPKQKEQDTASREDPVNIIRHIVKGFDVAHPKDAYRGSDSTDNIRGASISDAEKRAWSNPTHPTKPKLQLLDAYPLLPDLDALPRPAYLTVKFQNNPLAPDRYDSRLDQAILRPIDDPVVQNTFQRRTAEWNPESGKPMPLPEYEYELFVPATDDEKVLRGIKRKFDVSDPDRDDEELYGDEVNMADERCFKYERVRTYEMYAQSGNPDNFYQDAVAVALHDAEGKGRLAKGAYYYPIIQRVSLRPKRRVKQLYTQANDDQIDVLNLRIGEFTAEDRAKMMEKKAELDPSFRMEHEAMPS
ncbi:Paf1-domain-containing protein [Piedraia hortae CBS 480.64]|uniref:Paf1-domain-containing protein n=1 Tax=Piedraia hortae CBS 480.64 TaxID=1314780 RepID=A0A6A7C8Q4_9PEZI|nr:Paf1-domain-containing protein [Piedraia hortae CBS 480.64]